MTRDPPASSMSSTRFRHGPTASQITVGHCCSPSDAGEQDVQLTVHFLSPQDAAQVAWLLATCADSPTRDPATALELAERAVKYAGSDAESWAAYGAALYRAERWEEAVAALKTAEELPDAPPGVQLIHAMAQWQLGNHEEARQLYDQVAEPIPRPAKKRASFHLYWRRPPR